MDAKQLVIKLLGEYLDLAEEDINFEADLIEETGVDPGVLVELVGKAGAQMGVSIPDEEIEKVRTVQDLVNLLENYG